MPRNAKSAGTAIFKGNKLHHIQPLIHIYFYVSYYSCATDENWDVLKYETMDNLLMGEGISTCNLSLDYALYLSLTHSLVSVGVERSIIELNKP